MRLSEGGGHRPRGPRSMPEGLDVMSNLTPINLSRN